MKDFARNSGQLDVVYSETGRDREGKGYYGYANLFLQAESYRLTKNSFVEFETSADLKSAVEKLDGREFKGVTVHCTPDVCVYPVFTPPLAHKYLDPRRTPRRSELPPAITPSWSI